ncbi:MAG TPA: ROK family protein [Clostridiaceae bacterium]|nr:ROK family protein [Clostridiaceae bacterium]
MMHIDNLIDIKYKNIKSIIDYIRFKKNCTKKEISDSLKLSFATVSNMINLLMSKDLISKTTVDNSRSVGRNPKNFNFKPDRFCIITIDLHLDEYLSICQVDLARKILARETYEIGCYNDIGQFIQKVKNIYKNFVISTNIDADSIIGFGIIIKGIYDNQTDCMISSENKIFIGQPLRKLLGEALEKFVIVENDANIAALFSAISSGIRDLMYVYLGEGLGFSVISGGNILRGTSGYSPEIDHIPMGRIKVKCPYCGNDNCLSTDLSQNGFLTKYYKSDFLYKKTYKFEWEEYIKQIRLGDAHAIDVANENAIILGKSLAIATCITWPSKIIIGGIPQELYLIMKPVIENQINSRKPFGDNINLCFDPNWQDTIAKGAAEIIYLNWLPDL